MTAGYGGMTHQSWGVAWWPVSSWASVGGENELRLLPIPLAYWWVRLWAEHQHERADDPIKTREGVKGHSMNSQMDVPTSRHHRTAIAVAKSPHTKLPTSCFLASFHIELFTDILTL